MVDTTTTTSYPTQEACASRLPCGVCLLLGKMCPKVEQTFTPKWVVTCNTAK